MNIPTHTSNVTKYSNFLISISSKFWTMFSKYYIQILIKKYGQVYLLIIKFIAIIQGPLTNNQMNILRMNRSKTKHCVLHNDMIMWNSLPDIFKVNVSFSMFKSKVQNFYLEKYWCFAPQPPVLWLYFFFWHACNCGFSSATVFGFWYFAVKFPIISFMVIIRNVIVNWYVHSSW